MPYKDPNRLLEYKREWRRARATPRPTPWERFVAKVQIEDSGCWTWLGQLNNRGYGWVKRDGRRQLAHVWAYTEARGPVPEGLELDHLCHTESECPGGDYCPHRRCVNPDHLEPVTHQENMRRGRTGMATGALNRAKTHCPHGHLLDGVRKVGKGLGERYCKTCNRLRARGK